tara:strand:+ start:387 stop:629 length:243 start_codon:yes stop_codon:yes gene_type:complete
VKKENKMPKETKVKEKYTDYKVEDKNLERLKSLKEDLESQLKRFSEEEIKFHNSKLEATGALKVTMQLLSEAEGDSNESN